MRRRETAAALISNVARLPSPQLLIASLRALWALALARWALHRIGAIGVVRRNTDADQTARALDPEIVTTRCDTVAFVIPRIARRVPWRADCLVQALAGQSWLHADGIASEIVVGTARQADGSFEAHAWLRQGDRIILGGDIARFKPLLAPDPAMLDRD